jgi:hypothetical protein
MPEAGAWAKATANLGGGIVEMKARGLLVLIVAAAVVAVLSPALVRADLTVKEQTQMSGMMGMISSKGTETTYIKSDKMRTEGQTAMGGAMGGMMEGSGGSKTADVVTITRLDKGVLWMVNNDDSTYVEIPLKGVAADSLAEGFKIKDISVKKTGQTKEIIGYKCEGVEVGMTFEITVREGKETQAQTYSIKNLFWMRPEIKDLEELRRFWDQMVDVARASQKGSPMADAMGPLFGKMKEIQGVPLGMEMTMENPMGGGGADKEQQAQMKEAMKMIQQMRKGQGKAPAAESAESDSGAMKITREVTAISRGALADGLFEVPKGYRKTAR